MLKCDRVYRYLKRLLETGEKPEHEIFSMTIKQLQRVPELKDIGRNSVRDGRKLFREQYSIFVPPAPEKPEPSGNSSDSPSEDALMFIDRLMSYKDDLFHLLEDRKHRRQIQEFDLQYSKAHAAKQQIIQDYPFILEDYGSSKGIGVKINSDLFEDLQTVIKKTNISQRWGIHIGIKMFVEYARKVMEDVEKKE